MSSSNTGGRKKRNIRDHSFVVNAILHGASKDKNEAIDLTIYDIMKCKLKQDFYLSLESR